MSESPKAVFLSYAREDAEIARRIAEALRAFGVEVWFDQNELRGGDTWDTKIRNQIKTCALFLPLISQLTEDRGEGYFRREWKIAIDRTQDMGGNRAFIVPVVIDGTKEAGADVPEEFMRYQWTRLADGEPSPEFVAQVKRLLEAPRKPAATGRVAQASSLPSDSNAGRKPALPQLASRAPLVFGAIAVAAIATAIFFALRPATKEPAAAPASIAETKTTVPSPAVAKPTPAAIAADDKSVAVLAFADLSEARNSEYFSDGISEELLNVLAKVPGLRVAARTSAFFFKGKNVPIPEIAAKLNVAYVVEGSVQRAGENVRITAQLIKAADGYHVWSEHFDRELKNVFAVQDEIAGLIAKQLSLKLGASSAASTTSVNPQAFELYVQGRQAWNLRTAEGFARAEELLNRALALEPNFARAHAALADVWQSSLSTTGKLSQFGQRDSPEAARLLAQCDRALALDPNLAEAHAAKGGALWNCWRIEEAARELRVAISLNPNYATAHQVLGRVLLSDGRFDDATAELKRAAELDPLSHRILDNYSITLRLAGRFDESLAFDERALALQPDALQAAVWKALDLSGLGRHDEAVKWLRQLPVANTLYASYTARVFFAAGLKAEAEQSLAKGPATSRYIGLGKLGRPEEALAAMDPATMSIQPISELFLDPGYDSLRSDPRFVKLLATLGLTEAHARAQAWRAAHPVKW